MPRESLPIDAFLPEIVAKLRDAGATVLKAEPGAGKTTRVPPAMLDAGLADLDVARGGKIVVLQPRRVAARAAAERIAEDRGSSIGEEIGYQVRLEGRWSQRTRILICTEGILLRKINDDPLLEDVAAVVFDEFHERSLDGDVALAMVRQVREQVRPDLRILVMSATLDSAPIARYLGDCPTIDVPGRTYPVDIRFLDYSLNQPIPDAIANGVMRMSDIAPGHILAFLPGVGEIKQAEQVLFEKSAEKSFEIFPLFGDMDLSEQRKVLQPSARRKIILATNVAETSVTVDGVTAVVDSGLVRVSRFNPQLGLNRLEIDRVSRASANQRAGRAGRTAAGHCLRLWTEREHQGLREFDEPEISRIELSQAVLQLLAWGESDISQFGWFEPPPARSLERALHLLRSLDLLNEAGRLTDEGRLVASLPLQPRLGRLMEIAAREGAVERAAICAALLSERDPFRRSNEAVPRHSSVSDVLDRVVALEQFRDSGIVDDDAGIVSRGSAKQVLRSATQLARSIENNPELNPPPASESPDDATILQALLYAFPDRVCKRRAVGDRRALMVGGRGVRLSEQSAVLHAPLFVAIELTDSGKAESIVRQASAIEREWLPSEHVESTIETNFDPTRRKLIATRRVRYFDLPLEEAPAELPRELDRGGLLAEGILQYVDLQTIVDDRVRHYWARLRCLVQALPELGWPAFDDEPWRALLPDWCSGCSAVEELSGDALIGVIQSRLTQEQIAAVQSEAPESLELPSGRRCKLQYELGQSPVLSARIQELFGLKQTPRIARGRVPVMLHILAPNYRVQQITGDIEGFWRNTYPSLRKELRGRYPKHAWPENP